MPRVVLCEMSRIESCPLTVLATQTLDGQWLTVLQYSSKLSFILQHADFGYQPGFLWEYDFVVVCQVLFVGQIMKCLQFSVMFQARLEVHKFGITGYKKQEQRVWEQERAIMLGAKVVVAWFVPSGHPALTVQESSKKRWGWGSWHYIFKTRDPLP